MKTLFLFALFYSTALFAQITINGTDVLNVFTVGNSANINEYDGAMIDIGSPGGGNNWDFSNLQISSTFNLLSVNPASTPHISEFPGANIALYSQGEYTGYPADIWSYLNVNGTFSNMGQAISSSSLPGVLITSVNNPASTEMQLPLTYGTTWTQTFTITVFYNGSQLRQDTVENNVIVDAFGTMTMPGGNSFEALRIRTIQTLNGFGINSYAFQSLSGAQVNMQATNISDPNYGVIEVDWYDWNLPFTTGVEQISGLPQDFNLSQNYPNPFNPSTKIEYSIPEESFVQLKVYDVLGNEVATLVDEEQSAGSYRADFSGSDLSSGLYIAKLQTGNYSRTIKMTLMK